MAASVLCLFLFYGLCFSALFCDNGYGKLLKSARKLSLVQVSALALIAVAFMAFVCYWPRQDRFVYFWDYAAYWGKTIKRIHFMESNPVSQSLETLFQSINSDDYNLFLPTLLAFPLHLSGYTFPRYVVICCVLFLLPTLYILGLIVVKLSMRPNKGWLYVACVFAAFCFPVNYYSVFHGYIDVGYLLPMACAAYLLVDYDFRRISPLKNVVIALLLVLIWICRRYTVYFIIGYVVVMLVKAVAVMLADGSIKSIKAIVVDFLMIGTISIGLLLLFFRRFFLHALLTDYAQLYSAYNGTLSGKVMELVSTFGYISAALILLSGILCLLTKWQIGNYVALLVMGVAEVVLFWKTQNMGPQHRMILIVPVYILCVMPLVHWPQDERLPHGKVLARRAAAILCMMAMVMNFTMAFSGFLPAADCGALFSERYTPFQRNDIEALNKLGKKLNALTKGTKKHVYIAASGIILNSDILKKLKMPESDNAVPNMYKTMDVDLRDGFPAKFLKADYVVATDPIQVHLPTGQEVVTYLSALVQDQESYIGRHFKPIDEIVLDGGVVARIYEKADAFTDDDLRQLREHYEALYPDHPKKFADRIQ